MVAITAARVEPEGRTLTPKEATQVGLAWRVTRQQPPTSPNEKTVRTGGHGRQLSVDEPDGHRDIREDGTKRTRVEENSDDRMSSVTATTNKIDDDRLSKELRKLEEAKAIRKVKFAAAINHCDEGDVPAHGQTQSDEHFEKVRMLKGSFLLFDSEPTNDQIGAMRSCVVDGGRPRTPTLLCSCRSDSDSQNYFVTSPIFSKVTVFS